MNYELVFDCKNKSIEMSDAGQGSIERLGIKSALHPERGKKFCPLIIQKSCLYRNEESMLTSCGIRRILKYDGVFHA